MINFLIQTVKGVVEHDFCRGLIDGLKYQDWLENGLEYTISYSDLPQITGDLIPIGSVEFVQRFMTMNGMKVPMPINVPYQLMKYEYAKREIFNGGPEMVTDEFFVKSLDKIKGFTEITDIRPPEGYYQISGILDIVSEWRGFVYNGKLVGLKHYSGEFDEFPDTNAVYNMIDAYTKGPVAYTLDVAVESRGFTVPIEVHDFYSCGLYGFNDQRVLPFMFIRWWNQFKNVKNG